jgi:membrane associated rhomboid family serine protease
MIPFKDDVPTRSKPVVTVLFIVLNCLMFVFQLSLPQGASDLFVRAFGVVPLRLSASLTGNADIVGVHPLLTVFSSMFMHGGWLHLGGNMLYLWIFGNNVEDSMGRFRFVVFYLLSGIAAAATQVLADPHSTVPMVGASGAVAGVLGAYIILHPFARVYTLIIIIFFIRVVPLPAIFVLGVWFLLQILNGLGAPSHAGVAWHAHIGGFIAGLILIRWFQKNRRRTPDFSWE